MDPCPFVRLIVESLALKLPLAGGTSSQCLCKIRLHNFPSQTTALPISSSLGDAPPSTTTATVAFQLDPSSLSRLAAKIVTLKLYIYTGRIGRSCGVSGAKLLSTVSVRVDLATIQTRPGWLKLGNNPDKPLGRLHIVVRAQPEPRFVFQFGGEPECSPVVFQIHQNIRQPVFSCKFSAHRNSRSRSLPPNFSSNSRKRWLNSFSREGEHSGKERKGWMIMIYDLSGSPVAAASMITPFVPSPGSDSVSRSNPGAWLILRPHGFSISSWKPWGRLQVWRERGHVDVLGFKFELVTDSGSTYNGIPIAESMMSVKKGGQFCIDGRITSDSPIKGFVMASTVEGEGKVSKPMIQVAVQHVTCTADAALFVALSAAIDLSMDACRLFSHKLRKELCYDEQYYLS